MLGKLKIPIIILLTAVISSALTLTLIEPKSMTTASSDEKFEKLFSTYETIKKEYYQDTNDTKLVDGAINGMVESLDDPYSDYMNQKEAKSFDDNISSSFEGIGAEVQEIDGKIMIVSPIKGSPAEKAGLKPRDKILKVDNKSIEGMSVNEAVMLIRGEKGSTVDLVVERDGSGQMDFTITRDTIPLETVYFEVEDNVGKIQITKFSESTAEELKKAVEELESKNVKGLVLDLRQNPGGLMDQAILMSDMFVPKGKTIMQVENKDGSKEVYKAENDPITDLPSVVVVDKGTASAAEIMAAALYQSARIPVVGEKTFGKGTIQTAQTFNDSSSVKFTIAKWLTPNGEWIHEKGFKPQVKASLPEFASLPYLDPKKGMKPGDSGEEVKTAQKMLNALGYKEMKEEGFFDESTKSQVKAFQADHKLSASGELNEETIIKLMEALQKMIAENDVQIEKAIEVLKK
ncbi:S41 family peptidase [Metabacillus arenae]|uniref:C-terminal processing peptidase n=1 Tax=Metabacillus arenae TaxID=2771434 RepID=A0A926NEL1_9BACI|nr:S41 family peptidase [Metabacillus arenae]MBD1379033.1 peptidoglycan-binding protein [Metabacillus arenae]